MATTEDVLREIKTLRAELAEQAEALRAEQRAAWAQQQIAWVQLQTTLDAVWVLLEGIGKAQDDMADAEYNGELDRLILQRRTK